MNDKDDNEKELKELQKNAGLQDTTKALLAGLTAREAKVLRMRLGVDLKTNSTLEEVGKQFNVTRQRIREIENKALARLRCDDDPGAA